MKSYMINSTVVNPSNIKENEYPRHFWLSTNSRDSYLVSVDSTQKLKKTDFCSRINSPGIFFPATEFFSPTIAHSSTLNDGVFSIRLFKVADISGNLFQIKNSNGVKFVSEIISDFDKIYHNDTVLMAYEKITKEGILIYNVTKKEAYKYGCDCIGNFAKN